MRKVRGSYCILPLLLVVSNAAASPAKKSPFDDAVAVWHMADLKDSAGDNSQLTPNGDVNLGVALGGAEHAASLKRGGDGVVAEFQGGYLFAGQGANSELNLTGKAMTMCLRFRAEEGTEDTPLFSKRGGHKALVYNPIPAPTA